MVRFFIFITVLITIVSCNPFSPDYKDLEDYISTESNTTINGLINNFAYSYSFKDSFLYETLLDSSFIFKFNNNGVYESWNKDEDLRITKRMFRSFDQLELTFNSSFEEPSESILDTSLILSFNLNLYLGTELTNFFGHGKFKFVRRLEKDKYVWKINFWEDLQ